MEKIFVALSGGVDSSVVAALLKEQGADPTGLYLRHPHQPVLTPEESEAFWKETQKDGGLTVWRYEETGIFKSETWRPDLFLIPAEAADAYRMARFLEIPFAIFDASPIFRQVTDQFIAEYFAGRTPNPCVLCNRILKFGQLIDLALFLGAERFATGHYVRNLTHGDWQKTLSDPLDAWLAGQEPDSPALLRSEAKKDQSYVLYGIDRRYLPRLTFPLGEMTKDQTREFAQKRSLPVAAKGESQDICFIPDGTLFNFLGEHREKRETAGNFVDLSGKILGKHPGYERFTVGQRKGLGIGFGERTFVQGIRAAEREVVLGTRDDLARRVVTAKESRWLVAGVPVGEPFRASVKIRYRTPPRNALVTVDSDGRMTAVLEEAAFGVAPGQSLVCYWQDRLLGGGIIDGTDI